MSKSGILVLLLAALSLPALAETTGGDPAPRIKADLERVVADGIAAPVDGLTSSGQPSEEALQVFADSGFAAVIDLRKPGESRGFDEAEAVQALGMEYVSLPIDRREGVTLENAALFNEALAGVDGPVLVHCGSGNRAGALVALGAVLKGREPEAAIEKGRSAGLTGLEKKVREALAD